MIGHPLGSRLSLNQGKIIWRGKREGVPLVAVKMLGAEGASGSPFIDDSGRVVGILQIGLGSKDVLGQRTAGVLVGLDLVRWWGPRARLDLCRSYPNGGIAGCPSKPQAPTPPVVPPVSQYSDPAGDAATSPDVTSVTVASDAAANLTFTVRTNQPALATDAAVLVVFDIDQNTQTGGNGVESFFIITTEGWQFLKWNGSQFAPAGAASANGSYANGVATFRINKADLDGVEKFTFWVESYHFDAAGNELGSDTAPDGTDAYAFEFG